MHLNGTDKDNWETEVDELDIFLGPNFVVTHHDHAMSTIGAVLAACQRDRRALNEGADHLLYKIFDNVMTDCMPIVETTASSAISTTTSSACTT
jgi:magnesium transporter